MDRRTNGRRATITDFEKAALTAGSDTYGNQRRLLIVLTRQALSVTSKRMVRGLVLQLEIKSHTPYAIIPQAGPVSKSPKIRTIGQSIRIPRRRRNARIQIEISDWAIEGVSGPAFNDRGDFCQQVAVLSCSSAQSRPPSKQRKCCRLVVERIANSPWRSLNRYGHRVRYDHADRPASMATLRLMSCAACHKRAERLAFLRHAVDRNGDVWRRARVRRAQRNLRLSHGLRRSRHCSVNKI
jgi:hypothetical protein